MGFLDPFPKDPNFCTILLPSPNSNGYPSTNLGLLVGTYISSGVNIAQGGSVLILSFYNSLAYGPLRVYYCWCFCCSKFCEFLLLSIQSSYMSPSIYGFSLTFVDLVSLSLLIFSLCFLICFSCGDDICGVSTLYLLACTNVGTTYGATFLLIIFWAFAYVLSCFYFTLNLEVPPFSALVFLYTTLLGDSVAIFLLFSKCCLHLRSSF
jgi:hypothetical protein